MDSIIHLECFAAMSKPKVELCMRSLASTSSLAFEGRVALHVLLLGCSTSFTLQVTVRLAQWGSSSGLYVLVACCAVSFGSAAAGRAGSCWHRGSQMSDVAGTSTAT
jgi:hypothetical protein